VLQAIPYFKPFSHLTYFIALNETITTGQRRKRLHVSFQKGHGTLSPWHIANEVYEEPPDDYLALVLDQQLHDYDMH
jgi:hypothetical protein